MLNENEPVELLPHSVLWSAAYRGEARMLATLLATYGVSAIEHVGSTAVPNIPAKPIVDILIGVENLGLLPDRHDAFWLRQGYSWGHGAESPDNWLYFIKRDKSGRRMFHLHVTSASSKLFGDLIAFRNALLKDPQLASDYGALKITLASLGGARNAYRDGKTQFVQSVIKKERAFQ